MTMAWTGKVMLVFFTMETIMDRTVSLSKDIECGVSKGCYHDCTQDGCSFLISWHHVPDVGVVEMSMNKAVDNPYDFVWFAMGFSYDMFMGEDGVLECTTDELMYWLAGVRHSYNEQCYNVDINSPEYGLVDTIGRMEDGVLQCNFTKHVMSRGLDRIYDLDKPWYLLVANGYTKRGVKQPHSLHANFPFISPVMVDLREHVDVSGTAVFYLIKIHGCLMVFAWVLLASIGIVVARTFRQPWYTSTSVHASKWHKLHKALMACVVIVTMASFVVIWLNTKDFSKLPGSSTFQRAHPVIGVIIMGATLINPVIAILRPSKANPTKPTFKYAHGFIGTITFILAVLNIIIGVTLPKAAAPTPLVWLLTGFAIYQVLIHTMFESLDLYLTRSGKMYNYETSRNTRDDTKTSNKHPPGAFLKRTVLTLHVFVSLGVSLYCIVVLAM